MTVSRKRSERHDLGMTVRRSVLGDAHVDRAVRTIEQIGTLNVIKEFNAGIDCQSVERKLKAVDVIDVNSDLSFAAASPIFVLKMARGSSLRTRSLRRCQERLHHARAPAGRMSIKSSNSKLRNHRKPESTRLRLTSRRHLKQATIKPERSH